MKRHQDSQDWARAFAPVMDAGLALPDVEAAVKYDGSPLLKLGGCFMAGIASHPSAEPSSLVVRSEFEDRRRLIEEAPDQYYVTDHYRRYPVVLARLSALDPEALRGLLIVSRQLTLQKARPRKAHPEAK